LLLLPNLIKSFQSQHPAGVGSQPTKPQSQTQPSKADNSSAPPESVFSHLDQKSVLSRLGSRIPLNSLKITAPDQKRKKKRTARYEEHFLVNTISISYDTDPDIDTEVNMVQDDQSPPNQGRKGRPPKRVNTEGNAVGKGKTTVKTLIFSTMKKTVRSIPKCLSMKLKF
jgi:hypothetical protein